MSQRIIPIHYKKLIRIFEIDGFTISRKEGDHIAMTKPGVKRPLIIKSSPREVPVLHVKTNMKTAEMSREQYFELLKKV